MNSTLAMTGCGVSSHLPEDEGVSSDMSIATVWYREFPSDYNRGGVDGTTRHIEWDTSGNYFCKLKQMIILQFCKR